VKEIAWAGTAASKEAIATKEAENKVLTMSDKFIKEHL
jgi:hypothetical protein